MRLPLLLAAEKLAHGELARLAHAAAFNLDKPIGGMPFMTLANSVEGAA